MKIGYQGMAGSNAEEAAQVMVKKLGFKNVVFVPLVSSKGVMEALKKQSIDYGVMAIRNSIGGVVIETSEAIANENLEVIATAKLPIHHCLFKKSDQVPDASINKVASHIQALKQTKKTRERHFPGWSEMEIEDTAIGAKWLAEGVLSEHVAVICRKNAGEAFRLKLIAENIEDDSHNETEFEMFKPGK